MTQQTIQQVQQLLQLLGNSPGEIDGIWGAASQAALDATLTEYGVNVSKEETTTTNPSVNNENFWSDIKHFTKDEENITCPCWRCRDKKEYPEYRLMKEADRIRDIANKPMIPSSVRRCQQHNDELDGSVPNSYHIRGLAMDFDIPALADSKIKSILEAEKSAGRVRYWYQMNSGWFHFDVN